MKSKDIYILGVGNNTIVYIDLVESCGLKVRGLYHYNDNRTGEMVHNIPIIDSNINLFKMDSLKGLNFAVSVGDNKIRRKLSRQIREKGGNIPTLIHPTSIVSKYSEIDEGVVVHANSVVQADVKIEQDTVVSYNVSVTHTSHIGKACYLASGSNIGAYIKIQENVFVGQAATLVSGKLKYLGKYSVVGAGAVVIENVEPYHIVLGNPAKFFKKIIS